MATLRALQAAAATAEKDAEALRQHVAALQTQLDSSVYEPHLMQQQAAALADAAAGKEALKRATRDAEGLRNQVCTRHERGQNSCFCRARKRFNLLLIIIPSSTAWEHNGTLLAPRAGSIACFCCFAVHAANSRLHMFFSFLFCLALSFCLAL